MSIVIAILLTIFMLSILVLVHEFGHFIMAKMMGIRVLEFSLFMGPKIFSVRKGETLYSIRCIPLGGFCSMEGEETTSNDDRAFSNKPWYKRALVLIAGPAMNILLAVILSVIYMLSAAYPSLTIGDVIPGSQADQKGVQPGDRIVAVNGSGVSSYMEMGVYETMFPQESGVNTYTVKKADGNTVDLKVPQGGYAEAYAGIRTKIYGDTNHETGVYVSSVAEDSIASELGIAQDAQICFINEQQIGDLTEYIYYKANLEGPLTYVFKNPDGTIVQVSSSEENKAIGVSLYAINPGDKMQNGVFTLLGESFDFSFSMIKVTVKSFVWLLNGTASVEEVTGPVGMVALVNDTVASAGTFAQGALMYLILAILISVNLGVFNLLPFPALDGGRLVFTLIEAITRKKVKPEVEGIISVVGFVILIGLSILVLVKDVIHLF